MDIERRGMIGGRRLMAVAVAVLVLAGTAASVVSAQSTAESMRKFALPTLGQPAPQTLKKAMWGPGPPTYGGESQIPVFRDLGVGIYEAQVLWHAVVPTEPGQPTDPADPAYQWPPGLEPIITAAQQSGMQVALMIIGAPPWANGGRSSKWAPTDPGDFADFATAIARRYPTVHLWMIWGEPNRKPNFGPFTAAPPEGPLNHAQARAPQRYAQLLDAGYGALKEVNPANLVIGGNTFTAAGPGSIHTYQWIRYMRLPNGKRPRMDMYGHNPFGFRKPRLHAPPSPRGQVDFSDLKRLTKALDHAFPGPPLKLFLSEWGVPTDRKDEELGFKVTRAKQANWIRAAFRIVGRLGRIYTLGWVHPFDDPAVGGTQGLLDAQGNPKPGYFAFKKG